MIFESYSETGKKQWLLLEGLWAVTWAEASFVPRSRPPPSRSRFYGLTLQISSLCSQDLKELLPAEGVRPGRRPVYQETALSKCNPASQKGVWVKSFWVPRQRTNLNFCHQGNKTQMSLNPSHDEMHFQLKVWMFNKYLWNFPHILFWSIVFKESSSQ